MPRGVDPESARNGAGSRPWCPGAAHVRQEAGSRVSCGLSGTGLRATAGPDPGGRLLLELLELGACCREALIPFEVDRLIFRHCVEFDHDHGQEQWLQK